MRKLLSSILLCLPLLGATAVSAQPSLLGSGTAAVRPSAAAWVTRERPVTVDFSLLDARSPASSITVTLFDGQVATLDRQRVEVRAPGNHTWYGNLRGQAQGVAVLTVVDGHVRGSITTAQASGTTRSYEIASQSRAAQVLREIDPRRFPADHPVGVPAPRTPLDGSGPAGDTFGTQSTSALDTADFIDVMIVYSNQTATAAGTGIGAELQYAIDRANLAYGNSGVSTRVRLVHSTQVSYDEGANNFSAMLNQLTSTTDGVMDDVHTLRNTYGADLVSLFVERADACGIGWLVSTAAYGFTVVNRGCSGGNLTFAHELGHNIGARHDPYVDASTNPYAYGHGYTYPAAAWRTVMAYNDACVAAGTSCTRVPYLSNPNVLYNGVAMGTTATHDNARVHNERALTVANFRASSSTPSVQFDAATYSVAEGGGSVTLSVTRSRTTGEASVAYATASGTAASGSDFTATSGTLTFADGVATQTITVAVIDDTAVEANETFTVTLSNPTGVVLGATASSTVTITNNDVAQFRFGSATYSVTEGTTSIVIPVTRNTTSGSASVAYATASGTAIAGQDFTAKSGTLKFNNGVGTVNATISITNDTTVESSETFTVNLSAPSAGYSLGTPASTTVTIVDNDVAPASTVTFGASTQTVVESVGNAAIVVTRTGDTTGTATVNYAAAKGTARAGTDFVAVTGTLSFAANETTKTILVPIIDDTATEGAETFTVSLSSPVRTALGAITRITVTIAASD